MGLDARAAGDAGAQVCVCKVRFDTHLGPKKEGIMFEGWTNVLLGIRCASACVQSALLYTSWSQKRGYSV
jgi:hypothetical protein